MAQRLQDVQELPGLKLAGYTSLNEIFGDRAEGCEKSLTIVYGVIVRPTRPTDPTVDFSQSHNACALRTVLEGALGRTYC